MRTPGDLRWKNFDLRTVGFSINRQGCSCERVKLHTMDKPKPVEEADKPLSGAAAAPSNFLQDLTKGGVAVCGGPVVQPLAGRTENIGPRN